MVSVFFFFVCVFFVVVLKLPSWQQYYLQLNKSASDSNNLNYCNKLLLTKKKNIMTGFLFFTESFSAIVKI